MLSKLFPALLLRLDAAAAPHPDRTLLRPPGSPSQSFLPPAVIPLLFLPARPRSLLEYLEDIIGTNQYVENIAEAAKRLEELNEQRASQVQRLKVTEKEKDGLSGAKSEAEEYISKERELLRQRGVQYQLHVALARAAGRPRRAAPDAPFCVRRTRSVEGRRGCGVTGVAPPAGARERHEAPRAEGGARGQADARAARTLRLRFLPPAPCHRTPRSTRCPLLTHPTPPSLSRALLTRPAHCRALLPLPAPQDEAEGFRGERLLPAGVVCR